MAAGGSLRTNYYGNACLEFAWEIQSQNISSNQTTIYYQFRGVKEDGGYYTSGNFRLNIDGADVWSSATRISLYNGTIMHDGTYTFTHNNDGSRSFTVYIEGGIYTIAVNVSGSQSFALNNIPRYANITSFSVSKRDETSVKFNFTTDATCDWAWYSTNNGSSWNNLPANNIVTGLSANTSYNFKLRVRRSDSQLTTDSSTVTQSTYAYPYISAVQSSPLVIGNSQKLTLYNPLSRSVTIKMYQNSTSGTQLYSGSTSSTSITFTPTANTLYASIPNAQSSNCVYTATYSGHTATTGTKTYKIIGTETPTFNNFTYRDSNSDITTITGDDQVLVKGKSTLEVTISSANKMVAKNSAIAKSYNITCDTRTTTPAYSSNDIVSTLGTISNIGTKRLTVTAYDSRNLSTSIYKDINVYDYSKPVINVSLTRLNNFENETTLSVSGTYSRLTIDNVDKNSLTQVQYRYREQGGTWENYNTLVMTASNGVYSCTDVILNLDNTKAFEFEVVATDLLDTNINVATIDVGQAVFFISSNLKKCYINGVEVATMASAGVPTDGVLGYDGNTIPSGYEEVMGNSILTIAPSSNTTYSSTATYQSKQLTNLTNYNVKGNHISLNNNGEIQFSSNVKYVKISGVLCLNVVSSGKTYGINIIRSNNGTSKGGIIIPQVVTNGYYQNIVMPPILFPIEEGDVLIPYIYIDSANVSARVETYTKITIEEV